MSVHYISFSYIERGPNSRASLTIKLLFNQVQVLYLFHCPHRSGILQCHASGPVSVTKVSVVTNTLRYVPRAVAYPSSVGGMVYAKDDAPQPSDRAAVWVGMCLCKSFLRWVVCDLAHNLTKFAWSGEIGRAFPADVQKWIVDEGEGEGGAARAMGT